MIIADARSTLPLLGAYRDRRPNKPVLLTVRAASQPRQPARQHIGQAVGQSSSIHATRAAAWKLPERGPA